MASGRIQIGHYVLGETIGNGSFGKVRVAIHTPTGLKVAMKIIQKRKMPSPDMMARVKREIQYLSLLRNPHIIKLYEVIATPTEIIMVIEYAGGELFEYIVGRGRLSEEEARRFFQQIICAVDYCHSHKIAHRDLKPENLLLDPYDNVKLADFGLSNLMTDGNFLKTSCGSPNYAAPEVISGQLYAGPEVDVWSCGVILYVMLCGRLPFDDDHIPSLFKKINEGIFALPSFLSEGSKALLKAMLVVDPLKRICIREIRKMPWFSNELAEYLRPLPSETDDDVEIIDENIVHLLVRRMRYPKTIILQSLQDPENNPIKVAYHIAADHQKMLVNAGISTAKNDMIPTPPTVDTQPRQGDMESKRNESDTAMQVGTPPNSSVLLLSSSLKDECTQQGTMSVAKKHKKRSKWHFGIRSRGPPKLIMHEIYKALSNVELEWKTIDTFHVRCRYRQNSQVMAKFDIQLYRVDASTFVVDFFNVLESSIGRGHTVFNFFDMCSRVMFELSISD